MLTETLKLRGSQVAVISNNRTDRSVIVGYSYRELVDMFGQLVRITEAQYNAGAPSLPYGSWGNQYSKSYSAVVEGYTPVQRHVLHVTVRSKKQPIFV